MQAIGDVRKAFGYDKTVLNPPPASVKSYQSLAPYSFATDVSGAQLTVALRTFGSIRRTHELVLQVTGLLPEAVNTVAHYLLFTEREFEHAAAAAELVVELQQSEYARVLSHIDNVVAHSIH